MPTYEYRCEACENELEVTQRITDDPLQQCPSCGGHLHKLISNTSFILKGSGWYATDYARKNSHQKSQSKEEKSSTDTTDSADAKTSTSDKSDKKED
jgi:putative FmdB family regulatory protein